MTLLGVAEGNTRLDQTSLPRTSRCFKVDAKQQQLSSAAILEKHAIIITRIPVFHSLASSITARLPYQFFHPTSVAPLRTLTTPLTRITNACFTEGLSSCCSPSISTELPSRQTRRNLQDHIDIARAVTPWCARPSLEK